MAIHTFHVELYVPGVGPVPGVEDGSVAQIEDYARQAVRDSGLLPDGVTVLDPRQPPPPPPPPPGPSRPDVEQPHKPKPKPPKGQP